MEKNGCRLPTRGQSGKHHPACQHLWRPACSAGWPSISACSTASGWRLLLAIPAGGFIVRLFIIQHDCGHGSFFNSRKANDMVGTACGAVTLVAYRYWRKSHALHHAHSADLGERGMGDVWTMTVDEYRNAPRQTAHRLPHLPQPVRPLWDCAHRPLFAAASLAAGCE